MPTHPSCPCPLAHHTNTPRWGGCISSCTHELSNQPPHHAPHHHPHHHIPTHPMKPPTTHPTTTHPMNPLTNYPTTHPPTHKLSNRPTTTHPMSSPKYMYSDRVTLWICLMGGWVFIKLNILTLIVHGWVNICHAIARWPPLPVNYMSWFPSELRGKAVSLTESLYSSRVSSK